MVTDHQVTKKAIPFKCVHAGWEKFKIEIGGGSVPSLDTLEYQLGGGGALEKKTLKIHRLGGLKFFLLP